MSNWFRKAIIYIGDLSVTRKVILVTGIITSATLATIAVVASSPLTTIVATAMFIGVIAATIATMPMKTREVNYDVH